MVLGMEPSLTHAGQAGLTAELNTQGCPVNVTHMQYPVWQCLVHSPHSCSTARVLSVCFNVEVLESALLCRELWQGEAREGRGQEDEAGTVLLSV